jgi:hypothetical protein
MLVSKQLFTFFKARCSILSDPTKILLQVVVQPQRQPQGHLAHHGVGPDEETSGVNPIKRFFFFTDRDSK